MGERFSEIGAPAELAKLWFASLLRDGFALTASGDRGSFAVVGAEALRGLLTGTGLNLALEEAVEHVMGRRLEACPGTLRICRRLLRG